MNKKLYTVGEMASLCGVSSRTIRYYDMKGILKPAEYSEANYRLYDEKALKKLQKILMLKYLGFSLEQIERVMKEEEHQEVKNTFTVQKNMLKAKKEHLNHLIKAVETAEQADQMEIWDKLVDIIQLITKDEKIIEQYRTDENLQRRINIHSFGTSDYNWFDWLFDNMEFREGMKILEIGCGNGLLWTHNVERLPKNMTIILTDKSEGMLEKAKENINPYLEKLEEKKIQVLFQIEDGDDLQIVEKDFDVVIANHMLYHVKERQKLFHKIRDLLKKDGIFYCSTVGDEHMKELHKLVNDFSKEIEIPYHWITGEFRLENGQKQLEQAFQQVERKDHPCDLLVDHAQVIYDYVYSYPGNAASILNKCGSSFMALIQAKLEKEGAMYIHKSTGMFICKKGEIKSEQ